MSALTHILTILSLILAIITISIIQIKAYSYSEAGSRPLTWDQNQKGTITFNDFDYDYGHYDDSKVMEFMKWSMNAHSFVKLSLVEYVLLYSFH